MRAREIINEGPVWDAIKRAARKLFGVGEPSRAQINKSAISSLEYGLKQLTKIDYNSIDTLMKHVGKQYKISPQRLHDIWVVKYHMSPDDWIKNQKKSFWDRKL